MAETKNAPKGAAGAQTTQGGAAPAQKNGTSGSGAGGGKSVGEAAGNKMTKMDAVRRALAKLGWDAKPTEMQGYIKKTFGIDMTTDHVSNYKGDLTRKAREAGELTPQAAAAKKPDAPKPQAAPPKPQAVGVASSAPSPKAASARAGGGNGTRDGGNILLEDVLTTKELLDRVGAEKLRTLIDGLAK